MIHHIILIEILCSGLMVERRVDAPVAMRIQKLQGKNENNSLSLAIEVLDMRKQKYKHRHRILI